MKTRRDTTTGKRYSDADKGHPVSNGSHKGYGATRFARHRLAARVMSLILAVVLILVLLPDYTPASLTVQATGTEELTTEETQAAGGSTDGSDVDTQTTEESSDGNGTGEAGGSSTTETSEESTSGTNGTDSGTTESGDGETSTVQTAINAMTAFTQKAAELGWTQTMTTEETAAWVNALSQENVDALNALMETASDATDALTVEEYNQLESEQTDLFAQLELLAGALGAYEPMETATYSEEVTQLIKDLNDSTKSVITITSAIKLPDEIELDGKGKTVRVVTTGINEQGIKNSNPSSNSIFTIPSGATVTIKNMTIQGGSASAIVSNGNLTMNNVTVRDGYRSGANGAALYISGSGVTILKGCSFIRNVAQSGGAIYAVSYSGKFIIDGCSLTENRSISDGNYGGGAVELDGTNCTAKVYVNNSVFANNTGSECGGAINYYQGTIYLMNCTFSGNATTCSSRQYCGGARAQDLYAVNCLFADNYQVNNGNVKTSDVWGQSTETLINCLYGYDCKKGENSLTNTDGKGTGVYAGYQYSAVINKDGTQGTTTYPHPVLVKSNGLLTAPVKTSGNVTTEGTTTYFEYDKSGNVKMSYLNSSGTNTSLVGGVSTTKVANYIDGSKRESDTVIGACMPTDRTFYTVRLKQGENGTASGASVFGDSYESNSSVTLTAVADEGYFFNGWYDEEGNVLSYEKEWTFSIDKDYVLTPQFVSSVAHIESTNKSYGVFSEAVEEANAITNGHCIIDASIGSQQTVTIKPGVSITDKAYKKVTAGENGATVVVSKDGIIITITQGSVTVVPTETGKETELEIKADNTASTETTVGGTGSYSIAIGDDGTATVTAVTDDTEETGSIKIDGIEYTVKPNADLPITDTINNENVYSATIPADTAVSVTVGGTTVTTGSDSAGSVTITKPTASGERPKISVAAGGKAGVKTAEGVQVIIDNSDLSVGQNAEFTVSEPANGSDGITNITLTKGTLELSGDGTYNVNGLIYQGSDANSSYSIAHDDEGKDKLTVLKDSKVTVTFSEKDQKAYVNQATTKVGNLTIPTEQVEFVSTKTGDYIVVDYTGSEKDKAEVTIPASNGNATSAVSLHNWTYTAKDNEITAKCISEDGCSYHEGMKLSLTAENSTYNGDKKAAVLTPDDEWKSLGFEIPDVLYSKKNGEAWEEATKTVPTNAGTYKASVTVAEATASVEFTIAPKTITSDMITLDESSFVHDGNAKSPAVTVKDSTLATQAAQGTKTLTVCTTEDGATGDYALSGDTQATKYGKYTLKVTGKNNYTGTVDVTWNITDTTAPTFGEITYQEGTSSKVKNAWNWIIGKEVMTVTVPITEQGSGLTKDQIAITLTKASDCTLADSAAKAGGIDLTGDITNGYTLTFTVPKGFAGTYEITATDEAKNAGTYRLSQTLGEKGEIVIDSLAPSVTFELDKADYKGTSGAYDNKVSVEISVADNKTTATGLKSVSYQLDSNDAVSLTQDTWASKKTDSCSKTFDVSDRGVHTLTVTAEDQAGNTATQAITFAVYAAPKVTLTPTASIIYDGEAVAAGTDFTLNAGGSAGTVTYSYKKTGEADSAYVQGLPTDAGTYVIKADVARDTAHQYQAASVTSEITIAQKTAALTWTDMKFTYDGTEHAPSASVTNLVTGDAGRVSVTVVGGQTHANAHEGNTSYTATAEALTGERAANYKLPESGLTQVFTIDQKTAQLAWTNTEFTYDGAGHLPQATVMNLVGTDTAKDICTVTVNSGTGVINAGTYTLAATVLSNKDYKLPDAAADKQTTVTVNSKQLTAAMISLDSTDNIYAVTHAAITPAVTVKDSAIDTAQGGRTLVICTSETKNAGDYTLSKDTQATACGAYKMTVTGCNNYTGEVDITWYITDPNAPEGTIEISENKWTAFWNHVTFGKFFNKTQTVTITGSEDASESGVSEICYYLSDAELTQEELNALSDEDWKKLDTGDDTTGAAKKSGSFTMDPDSRQIVYARIADASGNITYLNSEGVTLDATKPVITGVTEGVTYCAAQTVTVTDAYLKSVTIRTYGKDADGTTGDTALTTTVYSADAEDAAHMLAADGTYTLPAVNGRVTVTAEDMAGNITEIAVTINDGHTFTDYVRSDNASTQQNATETAKCDFCDATDTREVEGTKLPVPVETVTIAEETEADGKIITAVNVDKELPKTEISNMTAALAKSLLTNTELALVQAGATVKVYLDVTDIDETVSSTDKALTEAAITTLGSNSHVGMYLDLSLFKQINNNPATRLTSSGAAMIRVAVTVPERLRNTDSAYTRTYNVVRIHDGKAELLNPTCEDYVLTFETDKFSTYAIVYTDTAVPVEPGTDTTTETPAVTTTTITQNPTETVQTANPTSAQTGDSVNLVLWISMLLLAATGIVIMTEVRRKRR